MKNENAARKIFKTISNFFIFFLLVSVVITCCLMLFTSTLQDSIGREFTQAEITAAAKATMVNVILISIAMAVIDYLRRKFTLQKPAEKISEAAEKMIAGDFSVRINQVKTYVRK